MASYYFLAASVLLVTITGTLVTDRIVEPRLGAYTGTVEPEQAAPLTHGEWRGLCVGARRSVLVLTAGVLWGLVPDDGFLQDPKRPGFIGSYFLRGLVFWIFVFGLVPGIVYGVGPAPSRRDATCTAACRNMELIAGYIVVVFFIAQFVNMFVVQPGRDPRGAGAALLRALDLGPIPCLIALVAMTGAINLLLGSPRRSGRCSGPCSCRCSCCSATRRS
jgi:aminobenzoyl-glutamate transport protein